LIPAAYRPLLAMREARLPLIGTTIGRLPLGAVGLAVILLVHGTTGSYAQAGVADAAVTIGAAVGLPVQGRIIDRTGQTFMLGLTQVVSAASAVGLLISARSHAGLGVVVGFAFLFGAFVPPLSLCMRGLWGTLIEDGPRRQSAYALDAVLLEVAFIVGPLLTAVAVAAASPSAAIVLSVVLETTGASMFMVSTASRRWRGAGGPVHWAGPLRSRGIRLLGFTGVCFGFGIGALILALTAFATGEGSRAAAGVLIAVQSLASLIGGLWYGSRVWTVPLERRYFMAFGLMGLTYLPLAAGWSIASMAVLVALTGLALAPASAIEYSLIDRTAPRGSSTEAFAWLTTATIFGAGLGEAVCGAIVNNGHVRLGLLLAAAGAIAAAIAAFAGRRTLAPQPAS
jgi:MFS family permease